MGNRILTRKLGTATKEELVEWVKVRREGEHFRATSGRGWHTVSQSRLGVCACSCKDYEFQRAPDDEKCCKHLWAMFKQGLIGLTQGQIATWTARKYKRAAPGRERLQKLIQESEALPRFPPCAKG